MSVPFISKSKIIIGYGAWWAEWTVVQAFVLHQIGFAWELAFTDALVTQLILALAGYTINTSMHSYHPSVKNLLYVLSWSIALSTLCVFFQREALLLLVDDQEVYKSFLNNSLLIRGAFAWLMIFLIVVLTWFWVYVRDHQESENRKNDALRLEREAELANLRQQLQPHFLFNSLNSISALVVTSPEQARKMVQQLSDFLRGTVRKDDNALVTLEEELQHLQLYLDIEKVRFGHRLNTDIQCGEEIRRSKLPSLLLQPVVENAIKFGLYDTIGEITIRIHARVEKEMLEIQVTNPFDPQTASPKSGTGFGLTAVQRRLDLLFFRNDLLRVSQDAAIFTTTLRIPQRA